MQSDPLGPVAAGQVSPFVTSARTVNAALDRLRNIGTGENPIPTLDGYPVGGVVPRAQLNSGKCSGSRYFPFENSQIVNAELIV